MARRSPMNSRYQKNQEPPGKTRKSAASAKPKRAEGSSAGSAKDVKGKKRPTGKAAAAGSALRTNLQTPEYRKVRRLWWGLLLSGVALVSVSWLARTYLAGFAWGGTVSLVALVLSYAAIFYALYLDFVKIRPLRQQALTKTKSGKPAKPTAEKTADKATSEQTVTEKVTVERTTTHRITK